jgi:hypothetical protein
MKAMDDLIYIVVYRTKNLQTSTWSPESKGIFTGPEGERLARNYAECLNSQNKFYEHRVVRGEMMGAVIELDHAAEMLVDEYF